MGQNGAHTSTPDLDSADQLIEEILHACPAESFDEAWIRKRYPDLPPEVWSQLRMADSIRRARQQACADSCGGATESERIPSVDELEFLRMQIPGYTILQPLGRGGQAQVYEAIQQSTQRRVAIKFLHQGPLASASQVLRFKREIAVVSHLRHPNIAQIHESGVLRGHYWFSMECVEGAEPIDDYVLLHQLSVNSVVELIRITARAMGFAHQSGVIHRDIKPSNILVDEGGQPRIVDFGLAKETGEMQVETLASAEGHMLGTLPYLSPEQVGDAGPRVDIRSDVYALGLVLYQLVTGGFPYAVTDSPFAVRNRILQDAPVTPRKQRLTCQQAGVFVPAGELNDDLERIILKALAKEAERRYQSALEFDADLQRYLNGEAVTAKADDYWYNLRKTLRRYRTQVYVAGLIAVVLGASLVFSIAMQRRAERVAFIAQSGLDAVAYFRLGSAARDIGRFDQAMELFNNSIKISEITDLHDPTLLAVRFDACRAAARICDLRRDYERGKLFRDAADSTIKQAEAAHLDPSLWQSKRAVWLLLEANSLQQRDQYDLALSKHEIARDILQRQLVIHPNDIALMRDLSNVLRGMGVCFRHTCAFDNGYVTLQESLALAEAVVRQAPDSIEDILDPIRCRLELGRCILAKVPTYARAVWALGFFHQAGEMLDAFDRDHLNHGLNEEVNTIRQGIDLSYGRVLRILTKPLKKSK